MCRSMADIRSPAAEIRRGKQKIEEEEDRKKLQGENIMAPLLHRAAITSGERILTRSPIATGFFYRENLMQA